MAFSWGKLYPPHAVRLAHASATPVDVADGTVDCAAGYKHSLLLSSHGSVLAWGVNTEGQLGRTKSGSGHVPSPVVGLCDDGSIAIAAGALHSVAVGADGRVYEWGLIFEEHDRPLAGEGEHGAAAGQHALVGLADRFGRNEYLRRLVLRSEAAYLANRNIREVTVESVAAGTAPSSDAGGAASGAPSEAGTIDISVLRLRVTRVRTPVPRLATSLAHVRITAIACGYAHTIALGGDDGCMYASGYNDKGQLGTGNRLATAKYKRVVGPDARVVKVACGQQHNIALDEAGCVYAWGSGVLGQCGVGTSRDNLQPVRVDAFTHEHACITDIAAGSNHSVAVTALGEVFTWGHSEYQQMGTSRTAGDLTHMLRHFYVPRRVAGLAAMRVVKVAAGGQFTVVVTSDGEALSFGWNAFHCLGHGEYSRGEKEIDVVDGLRGRRVHAIACGYNHAIAVTEAEGHAYAAGWLSMLNAVNLEVEEALTGDGDDATARSRAKRAAMLQDPKAALDELQALDAASGVAVSTTTAAARDVEAARKMVVPRADVVLRTTAVASATAAAAPPGLPRASVPPSSAAAVGGRDMLRDGADATTTATRSVASQVRQQLKEAVQSMDARRKARVAAAAAPTARASTEAEAVKATGTDVGAVRDTSSVAVESVVPAAVAGAVEPPVHAHAVILMSRCTAFRTAFAAARAAPGTKVEVASSAGPCGMFVCFAGTLADGTFEVNCDGHRRVILRGLMEYLYTDRMPQAPAHRVAALQRLALCLNLPRLVEACDHMRHAYDVSAAVTSRTNPRAAVGAAGLGSPSTFVEDMRRARRSGEGADVELLVHHAAVVAEAAAAGSTSATSTTSVFYVHRLLLCRHEYFDRLVNGWAGSDSSGSDSLHARVEIRDVDAVAFEDVLDYMYTGDAEPLRADPLRCLSALALAARFCIQDLLMIGQDVIAHVLTRDNAEGVLEFAQTHGLSRLTRLAGAVVNSAATSATSQAAVSIACGTLGARSE